MRRLLLCFIMLFVSSVFADSHVTKRIPQISNEKVNVWQTVIYPNLKQVLKLHRHEYNRIVVAFNSGTLKITDTNNQVHYLKLQKGRSYYLEKDVQNEMHSDENISGHPIKVTVVELKY